MTGKRQETNQSSDSCAVLIVDDHATSLVALRSAIEPLPVRVLTCESGEDALRTLLNESHVAAILLDIRLPGMDGFETAAAVRKRAVHQHTHILFLTGASNDEDHLAKGQSLGAVDYMLKPVQPGFLRTKVSVLCDLYMKTNALQKHADGLAHELRQLRGLADAAQSSAIDLAVEVQRYANHVKSFLRTGDGQLAQRMAQSLFERRVSGKQIIEVHLAALDLITAPLGDLQQASAVREARLLVLGVLANLADMYRARGFSQPPPEIAEAPAVLDFNKQA